MSVNTSHCINGLVRGIFNFPELRFECRFSKYCLSYEFAIVREHPVAATRTMSSQQALIETFRELHKRGNPLILYNIWDAGSAKAVSAAGASALATGSAPVAMAQGFSDGEHFPLELALANIERIVGSVDLPVTMDLESGYGKELVAIEKSVTMAISKGIVGFNFEDQMIGGEGLYDITTQTQRIASARNAADSIPGSPFINARTDIFLKAKPDTHNDSMLDEAIERAHAYQQAGADGFFAPGLADEKLIERLCNEVELPVNIIALPHVPEKSVLAKVGVSRISYGPVPYKIMMKTLGEKAKEAFS